MIYDLAQWFLKKSGEMWRAIWYKGFFGKVFFFPIYSIISLSFLLISLFFYAASFMVILENIGRAMFFYFKRKVSYSGFIGKIIWLPFLSFSIIFCMAIILFTIGMAMPFKQA